MPLKQYKATSPVRRFRQSASFEELTRGKKPERGLIERKLRHAGRNAQGRVTTRHRGGGEKRNYRMVDRAVRVRVNHRLRATIRRKMELPSPATNTGMWSRFRAAGKNRSKRASSAA